MYFHWKKLKRKGGGEIAGWMCPQKPVGALTRGNLSSPQFHFFKSSKQIPNSPQNWGNEFLPEYMYPPSSVYCLRLVSHYHLPQNKTKWLREMTMMILLYEWGYSIWQKLGQWTIQLHWSIQYIAHVIHVYMYTWQSTCIHFVLLKTHWNFWLNNKNNIHFVMKLVAL